MHIILLISGIADPKWPPPALPLATPAAVSREAVPARKLSPFDESALECALKVRDAQPDTRISALVIGAPVQESLLRAIAAFRLDRVTGVTVHESQLWDARSLSQRLGDGIAHDKDATDLVLMGREFGDFDDGMLAPFLAEMQRLPFVGLVQEVKFDGGEWVFFRERGDIEERIRLRPCALASITNDKRNRLRYPLMKNIVVAKKATFAVENAGPEAVGQLQLVSGTVGTMSRKQDGCRLLTGSVEDQAAGLSTYLLGRVKS